MAEQTDRMDMVTNPTEFTAFILRSQNGEKLRIYFYTVNQPGIGRVDAPMNAVREDVLQGWGLWANLHNHNFFVNQKRRGGGVAPSQQDVSLFRSLAEAQGLQEAWITNGFDTLRIKQKDFLDFHVDEVE